MRGDEVVPAVTHAANHGPSIDLLALDELREPVAMEPDRIVAELEVSGLVGYGGAGFPTARKWATVRGYPGPRTVIVKRMLPHVASSPGAAAMFAQEARLASHIGHPNVVRAIDSGS